MQNPYRCHNPDNSQPTLLTKLWADLEDSLHFRPEKWQNKMQWELLQIISY